MNAVSVYNHHKNVLSRYLKEYAADQPAPVKPPVTPLQSAAHANGSRSHPCLILLPSKSCRMPCKRSLDAHVDFTCDVWRGFSVSNVQITKLFWRAMQTLSSAAGFVLASELYANASRSRAVSTSLRSLLIVSFHAVCTKRAGRADFCSSLAGRATDATAER